MEKVSRRRVMIAVNAIYQRVETGEKFRVLWINPSITYAYVIDLKEKAKMPYEMLVEDIKRELLLKEIRHIEETVTVSTQSEKVVNNGWGIIQDIVKIEPEIYQKNERYRLIEGIMSNKGVSDVTIYSYLKRFWQGGMTPVALNDMRFKSGGKGKEKNRSDKKMGRRTRYGTSGIPVTEEVKRQIKVVLEEYYFKKEEATLAFAYDMLITLYYSSIKIEKDGSKIVEAKDERLTRRQFHYWARKLYNPSQTIRKKIGEKRYQKDHRGTAGSSIYEAPSPGSRFEIDSTPGDIYLVSEYDRTNIIGKPTIYAVVDVFSRLIVGFYVGLESSSSWFGAIQALINTIRDKVHLCGEYDIQIKEEQWPAKYFPKAILADRAEFIGYNSDLITKNFNVRVENTSSFRADMKGTVEKILDLIPKYIRPFAPGFIEADYLERGGKDYRLEAKLTIKEFSSLIIECIIHYNNSIRKEYPLTKEMILENIVPAPCNLWEWGCKNNPSNLRHYDQELVYYSLLPRGTATVTQEGIKFKGARYTCELADNENWFALARNNGTWKVTISYDSRNTNYIYLHNGNEFLPCELLPHQESFANVTFEDLDFLDQKLKRQMAKQETSQLSKDITHLTKIKEKTETFVAQADKELEGRRNEKTKSESIKNINYYREIEKNKERKDSLPVNQSHKEISLTSLIEEESRYNRKSILELGLFNSIKE